MNYYRSSNDEIEDNFLDKKLSSSLHLILVYILSNWYFIAVDKVCDYCCRQELSGLLHSGCSDHNGHVKYGIC